MSLMMIVMVPVPMHVMVRVASPLPALMAVGMVMAAFMAMSLATLLLSTYPLFLA